MFKRIILYGTALVSLVVVGSTLLSLLYDVNVWWIKVLDFPRLQTLMVGIICLVTLPLLIHRWSLGPILLIAGLLSSVALQTHFVYPYTPWSQKDVPTSNAETLSTSATVRLLIANVYMHNQQAEAFLQIAEQADPDMILVMETNRWWMEALQPFRRLYPHYHEYPTDNTYGMGLYSRYPLKNLQTKFFQHDSVPSFHTEVLLPGGRTFYFHGVHPVPPVYSKHPDNKGEQEIELIKVGQMVAAHRRPAVVAGDFNDVAWSSTSRLFQVEGQLHDTRVGRGLYNSFNAQSLIMRWPLDHVYTTEDFELVSFQRLGKFGSDHFPIYAELVLVE